MDHVEARRLERLAGLRVMGSAPESDFDEAVALAAVLAGVPTALIGLIDDRCQWYKAKVGVEADSVPRDDAVCELVLSSGEPVVIDDMSTDPRTRQHPQVVGGPGLRFYAGFPIAGRDGLVMGTLCLLDTVPRTLSAQQRTGLTTLARQVMAMLDLRRLLAERDQQLARAAVVERDLERARREFELLALHSSDVVSRHDASGRATWVSPSVRQVLGYAPEQEVAQDAVDHCHPDDQPLVRAALARVALGERPTVVARAQHADGSWRHMEMTLSPLIDDRTGLVEVYSAARDVTDRVRAEAERNDALELKRAVLASIPVGIVTCSADGRLRLFNSAARRFHGIDVDAALDMADWASRYSLFHVDGSTPIPSHQVPLRRALAGEEVEGVELVIAPHDRPPTLVSCTGRQLRDSAGEVTGAVVSMTDITAVRAAEQSVQAAHEVAQRAASRLAENERQFRDIFESGPLAIAQLDATGDVLRVNPALRRLIGRSSNDVEQRGLTALVAPEDRAALLAAVTAAGTGAPPAPLEVRLEVAGRRTAWCEMTLSAGGELDGRRTVLVQIADVDERKRRELDLERLATHDPLTGLPNRAALRHVLRDLAASGPHVCVQVLFLDLDGFKAINDEHGHGVGDEVLVAVAGRLRRLVRPGDTAVRLAGDEFVLLHAEPADDVSSPWAGLVAERARAALREPFITSAGPMTVGLSLGIAEASTGDGLDDLLRRADEDMYRDKRVRAARR